MRHLEQTAPDLSKLRISAEDKVRPPRKVKTPLIILFIFLVTSIGLSLWYHSIQSIPSVTVEKVQFHDGGHNLTILNASGYVTPRQRATISADVTGRIIELFVEEGQNVQKGSILAKLDDRDAQASVETAKADVSVSRSVLQELQVNLEEAKRNSFRYSELQTKDAASQQQVDDVQTLVSSLEAQMKTARNNVLAAEARLKSAQLYHEKFTVIAPFSGIVVSKDAQIGEIVSPVSAGGGFTRTGIATIVDMNSLEIEVDVNEAYIAKVTVGQRVTANLDAYPTWELPASVRTIIPTADRQKATVKVRISFEALDPKILPDMGIKVAFLDHEGTSTAEKSFLSIPPHALISESGKDYVFVFKNGAVEKRAVKKGPVKGNRLVIEGGLQKDEVVVTDGLTTLSDKQHVKRETEKKMI